MMPTQRHPLPLQASSFTKIYQNHIYDVFQVDSATLVALSALSIAYSQGIQANMESLIWFLD